MGYITKGGNQTGCVFCDLAAGTRDDEALILYRGASAFVVLNKFPYVSGHLMIVPYRHVDNPALLDPAEWAEAHALVPPAVRILEQVYQPQGFNLGMNIGRAAGAGIDGHIHLHVIPRWNGDSNFVSVVAETRVIPEALEVTYARLLPAFAGLKEGVR